MRLFRLAVLATFILAVGACDGDTTANHVVTPQTPAEDELTTTSLPVGDSHCPYGGSMFTSTSGDTSYACNGAPGTQGVQGEPGTQGPRGEPGTPGMPGADGQSIASLPLETGDLNCGYGGSEFISSTGTSYACNGAPGANGQDGQAGQSVTASSVAPGDSQCPYGGSRFVAASGTTYACNAPGSTPLPLASSYRVFLDIGEGEPIPFAELEGLGTENEVIEQAIVTKQGTTHVKIPGRMHYLDVTLRRGISTDLRLADWRRLVEVNQITDARRQVGVLILDGTGHLVSAWTLSNAWPMKLAVPGMPGPFTPYVVEEVVIASENAVRVEGLDAPARPPRGASYLLTLQNGDSFQMLGLAGMSSTTEVVEHTIVDGSGNTVIVKLPGRLYWGDVTLRCNGECGTSLQAWRTQVKNGDMAAARQAVTITALDADDQPLARWTISNAWPSATRVVPAPDGGTFEELTIANGTMQRID